MRKKILTKASVLRAIIFVSMVSLTFHSVAQLPTAQSEISKGIFPQGEPVPAQNFTGKAWNYGLVPSDSTFTTLVGNVYFEAGTRTNWHTHPAGQILIITEGTGYHQIKGQPRQQLNKGDVVQCPPNVLHWHGASPNTSMQQLYIVPNTEKGIVTWMQPVTDEEYIKQK